MFLSWILLCFEALSGLRANLEKGVIMSMGEVETIDRLTDELGYRVRTLPSTYLGLPLGTRQSSVSVWEGNEEAFRRRFATWKIQYISKGGRLTLIRSTLSNLPIYLISLFKMPKSVVDDQFFEDQIIDTATKDLFSPRQRHQKLVKTKQYVRLISDIAMKD